METGTSITEKSQTAYEILAYLAEHPDAQDTLEGIMEWWLLEQEIRRETAKVKEALAELVAKGLVLERKGKGARIYYRVNRRKSKEIRTILKKGFRESG
jgi:predicted transcriptional regulator